jgi:hypothetical protein
MSSHTPQEGATSAQLKHDIDSGRTGDKVGGFDPAAAPLGTDEEAGGAPLSPQSLQHARAMERNAGRSTANANGAEPALQPDGEMRRAGPGLPILIGVGAAALLAAALFIALV